jgi:hypothetical protein
VSFVQTVSSWEISVCCAHRIDFFTAGKVEQDNLKSRRDCWRTYSKAKYDFDELKNRFGRQQFDAKRGG